MLGIILLCIIALAFLFGGLCIVTGEGVKGNIIVDNCITALFLYFLLLGLFNGRLSTGGIFDAGLPLVSNVEKAGSVRLYLINNRASFAIDFVELVTLIFMINWVSNLFLSDDENKKKNNKAGLAGKTTLRIIIILAGIIVYGFFMNFARENIVMKWCVYCVECIITGGSIIYTPVMIVAFFSGLKTNNPALIYIVKQFPKTSIGKAISSAITMSVMFLALLLVLETQYGSVCNIITGVYESLESIGASIMMLFGIYFLLKILKK